MTAPADALAKGSVSLVLDGSIAAAATLCTQPPDMAYRYLLSDGRRVTRCAAGGGDAVAYLNALRAPGLVVNRAEPDSTQVRRALAADRGGYEVVWVKGALDAKKVKTRREASKVASKSAAQARPQPQHKGPAYVQVGVFGEPANAERAIALLKSRGFKVSTAQNRSGSRPLRMVFAGPFNDPAELSLALGFARQAGYRDAFIRR